MKKKKNKLKVLATAAAMVLVMGATAATTWALTNIKMDAGFKIQINGSRNVEATITGASFLNNTKVEDMDTIVLNRESTSSASATFDETIPMSEVSDVVSYNFSITNNCDDSSYSNLVIKPTLTITDDYESAVSTFYVSTTGTDYEVLTDEYLTLFTDETIYIKLNVVVPEMLEVVDYTGNISFDLYSEKYAPVGYAQDYEYSVVDGVGYKAGLSSLGTTSKAIAMDADEYVIATPSTAQDVLDSDINGKVVVFTKSEDGTSVYSDVLNIQPTRQTISAIYNGYAITNGHGDLISNDMENFDFDSLDANKIYHYERNLTNVVFAGTKDVTFTNFVQLYSGNVDSASTNLQYNTMIDPIKATSIEGISNNAYTTQVNVTGLTFTGMNFVGNNGRIFAFSRSSAYNDVKVENCSFVNNDTILSGVLNSAIHITSIKGSTPLNVNNVEIKNNSISGYYLGIYVGNGNNVKVVNNSISNTSHNGIAIQTSDAGGTEVYRFAGNIVVTNNTISNTGDRAVRFGVGENANIVVENNSFTSAVDTDSELVKTQASTNTNYAFVNNTYDGNVLANEKGSLNGTQWIINVD